MNGHHLLLIIHLVAACIWIGGHFILAIGVLPKAMREKDPAIVTAFEAVYEKIGIPALAVLVATGIWMAYDYGITFTKWFAFDNSINNVVSVKLILLLLTLILAVHARLFIIPKLDAKRLPLMAAHIILLTIVALSMLAVGTFVRYGGF